MKNNISVEDLIKRIVSKEISISSPTLLVRNFAAITNPNVNAIYFYKGDSIDSIERVLNAEPTLMIVENIGLFSKLKALKHNVALSGNARKTFAEAFECAIRLGFVAPKVDDGAIHKSVQIGKHSVIDPDVQIGQNCKIGNNVSILNGAILGNNVVIGDGTVIGGEGFGYIQELGEKPLKFPHLSNVVIENDVEIGYNVCIDRGSLTPTLLNAGVKIDNLVHIAHGVVIGANSFVIAGAIVCGSAIIGENCWIAPQSVIREGIKIGDNSLIGLGSVVIKDAPRNSKIVGNPGRNLIR